MSRRISPLLWGLVTLPLQLRAAHGGGRTEIFVADETYFLVWVIDGESGAPLRGFSLPPDAAGSLVPRGTSGLAAHAEDVYYTHSSTLRLWVLDARTGGVRRTRDKPELGLTALGAADGAVYAVGSTAAAGALYTLDPRTLGVVTRTAVFGAQAALDAAPGRGSLFVRVGDLEIRELAVAGGATRRSLPPPPEPAAGLAWCDAATGGGAGQLFALSAAGKVFRLDPASGEVLASFDVRDTSGRPVEHTGGLAARQVEIAAAPGGGAGDAPTTALDLQDTSVFAGDSFEAFVLLSSDEPAQGFQTAVAHDPGLLLLQAILTSGTQTEAVDADFTAVEIFPNGGTLGVVFDLSPPFLNNVLPPGVDQPVARYHYACVDLSLTAPVVTEARFVDGVFGSPAKDNVIVVEGRAVRPDLFPGRITCKPRPVTPGGPTFFCGGALGGDGLPLPLAARSGDRTTLCLYYSFPEPSDPLIQGLSMALAYDCRMECLESSFTTPPESILAILGADFVSFHCDNDPGDGDGCEMVLGVLVDADPPFDQAHLPATAFPLLLGCVTLEVGGGVVQGECLPVTFRDGLNGREEVPIKNLVSVHNQSVPAATRSCEVCITAAGPGFFCGSDVLDEVGRPGVPVGLPGEEVDVCFWYSSPDGPVEALTQAIRFDCRLECVEGSFRLAEDLPELQAADFISFDCESSQGDGDPCELVLKIIARSPSTGNGLELPASNEPRRLGCARFRISPQTRRGACLSLDYFDGATVRAGEPAMNQVTIDGSTVSPQLFDCKVCALPAERPKFLCGGATLGPDGLPVTVREAGRGAIHELCFWYTAPVDELTAADEIQGLSMAICFDCGLRCLEDTFRIPLDGVLRTDPPEFISFHCDSNPSDGDGCEMVLGLLMDVTQPITGRVLPPTDVPRKLFCVDMEVLSQAKPGFCLDIRFCDGVNGRGKIPIKNLVSIENFALTPELCDCAICIKHLGPKFLCGGARLGRDNLPEIPTGKPGQPAEACFWYCSPEDNSPGHQQFDHIQGVSMALTFDCRLRCLEDTIRLPPDSITAVMEAEFVDAQCDNDPNDGDGCELIIGILLDVEPPFDGRTLPPTAIPLKLACISFLVPDDGRCGDCFDVRFTDGVNGKGKVPIFNQVAVENMSFLALTTDCKVCIVDPPDPVFRRGDCNFDRWVDIADAAEVVSYLFAVGAWKAQPPCPDACDVNDDGRVDLADAQAMLMYLFLHGREPPAPGPGRIGPDPTLDKLPCYPVDPCP